MGTFLYVALHHKVNPIFQDMKIILHFAFDVHKHVTE